MHKYDLWFSAQTNIIFFHKSVLFKERKVMKHVGLVIKPDALAEKKADELEQWFTDRNVRVVRKHLSKVDGNSPQPDAETAPSDLFCVFVLGGDGTFLSAARWIGDRDIPMLGIKFGDVGFLAEIAEESLFHVAEKILNNNFDTRLRSRLEVRVIRNNQEIACETVLNDIVINKGALARLANIQTYINGHYLTTYKSDGLIVATPTGSTAYSLAAGGPIVHPAVSGMVMTPICPFTLTNRPLIVPDTVTIEIRLAKMSSNIMLTFDGQEGLGIDERDNIIVKTSPHPIRIIIMPDRHYFDVLKAKLRWSGSRI
jgi:NAD+ kinase